MQFEGCAEASRETFGFHANELVHEGFSLPAFKTTGQLFQKLWKFLPLGPEFPSDGSLHLEKGHSGHEKWNANRTPPHGPPDNGGKIYVRRRRCCQQLDQRKVHKFDWTWRQGCGLRRRIRRRRFVSRQWSKMDWGRPWGSKSSALECVGLMIPLWDQARPV